MQQSHDKIISLYARGMTVREIQAHLEEMYGTEVSPSLISSVTDAVADEVKAWQARPLEPIYPIVYLDCIHVKVREGAVRVKAVYLAIGITMTGEKEVLGLWLAQTEGAKFWLQVVTELRNRGVQDWPLLYARLRALAKRHGMCSRGSIAGFSQCGASNLDKQAPERRLNEGQKKLLRLIGPPIVPPLAPERRTLCAPSHEQPPLFENAPHIARLLQPC